MNAPILDNALFQKPRINNTRSQYNKQVKRKLIYIDISELVWYPYIHKVIPIIKILPKTLLEEDFLMIHCF